MGKALNVSVKYTKNVGILYVARHAERNHQQIKQTAQGARRAEGTDSNLGTMPGAYVAWANNGARPIPHVYVVTVFHAIAYCAIPDALLALLELFKKPKVPWNCKQMPLINQVFEDMVILPD